MPKRINIKPTGAEEFRISEVNPNDDNGGGCLCGSSRPEDQTGPFIVFNRQRVFPHAYTGGRRPQLPVICAGCAKAALVKIERGDEVSMVGTSRPEDKDFDGGVPDDPPTLTALRHQYQQEATTKPLAELLGWDDWLTEKGYTPAGTPAAGTRATSQTGIDPDAKPLVHA